MCFIEAVERHTDWTCGECDVTWVRVSDIDFFYLYRGDNGYKMLSRAQAKKRRDLTKPIYSGKLEACLEYIRKHEKK